MTAPADLEVPENPAQPDQQRPEGTAPVSLVLAVEGIETSDGRYIEPGALTTRPMPLGLYAQVRSTHGLDGDAATWNVGAITSAERVPGPSVVQRSTGKPFAEGTFVWLGKGWMYTDVPSVESGSKPAYTLVKDGALRGNSVDLSAVDAEFEYDTDEDGQLAEPIGNSAPRRIVMSSGVISSTTLVGIPAFMDAYIALDDETLEAGAFANQGAALALEISADIAAGATPVPAWRSLDTGDVCGPCSAARVLDAEQPWDYTLDLMANVSAEKRKRATKAGHALPDGSYPIENPGDLDNAISAVGRAGGKEGTDADRNRVRRHIIKQAKRLKLADKIPDTWNADGTLKTEKASAATEPLADILAGDDYAPPAVDEIRTSGMVALIPSNPTMLAAPGGDAPDQIHLTLAYLGDQIDEWSPEQIAAVHRVAMALTNFDAMLAQQAQEAEERGIDPADLALIREQPSKAQRGPLTADVFAHAIFNPNGDHGFDPATVYLFDGNEDRFAIEALAGDVCYRLRDAVGDVTFPDQHTPYVPHVTAGYNLDPNLLTYTGPVEFDRLRVAIGEDTTDYPLGGGQALVASIAHQLPPAEWFQDPKLDGPTAVTVTDAGRVYGHLAEWGTCHVGFVGQCVTPPTSPSAYAYYRVHGTRAINGAGETITVPVGYATVGTGHAGPNLGALAAAEHYDNTGTAVMELAAGEDAHGIWVAGRLLPGLDELTEHKARGIVLSGDWRTVRGNLELVAALGVNTPGFPVKRVRVASGVPVSLVAAGITPHRQIPGREWDAMLFAYLQRNLAGDIDAELGGVSFDALAAEIDADTLLVTDGDHPWFLATVPGSGWEFADDGGDGKGESGGALTAAGKKKIHLPPYIKRIAKHLEKKGMAEGRAIATAKNAADKMCTTGDTSLPGVQQINPGSRAEACKAIAQWKADRPGAK
jgi:hypothetical protein